MVTYFVVDATTKAAFWSTGITNLIGNELFYILIWSLLAVCLHMYVYILYMYMYTYLHILYRLQNLCTTVFEIHACPLCSYYYLTLRQHPPNRARAGRIQLSDVTPLCPILVSQIPVFAFLRGSFHSLTFLHHMRVWCGACWSRASWKKILEWCIIVVHRSYAWIHRIVISSTCHFMRHL